MLIVFVVVRVVGGRVLGFVTCKNLGYKVFLSYGRKGVIWRSLSRKVCV